MTFNEIKTQALSEWETLKHSNKPQILVETSTCSEGAGALSVLEAIKSALTQHHIEATIIQVGCAGLCYAEPLVDIIKPNRPCISYGHVTPEIASQLIDYLVNDNPRPDLALGTIGEGSVEGIPRLSELPMLKLQTRASPEPLRQYRPGEYQSLYCQRRLQRAGESAGYETRRGYRRGKKSGCGVVVGRAFPRD